MGLHLLRRIAWITSRWATRIGVTALQLRCKASRWRCPGSSISEAPSKAPRDPLAVPETMACKPTSLQCSTTGSFAGATMEALDVVHDPVDPDQFLMKGAGEGRLPLKPPCLPSANCVCKLLLLTQRSDGEESLPLQRADREEVDDSACILMKESPS